MKWSVFTSIWKKTVQRAVTKLEDQEFDLVIIGGGIFAACAAWDASLRGLSVAIIEQEDFGSGSSANSLKFIHGGIRYLQHGDIIRLKSSCRERSAMLRIAPHLVSPLPVLIPTYGHGKSGKLFLGIGMYLYDLLTLGRNRGIRDSERHIPLTRFLNKKEVLLEYPDLDSNGLTGAALFSDAQMYNPLRLVLSFVKSAVDRGAVAANYVAAENFIRDGRRIVGVQARDRMTNKQLNIKARTVLNAAGPWSDRLLQQTMPDIEVQKNVYSRDACFLIKRRFSSPRAIAVQAQTKDPDALLSRPARHLFLVPWREYTLVGVWHVIYDKHPEQVDVDKEEIQSFIDEINWAYPSLKLMTKDVCMWNAGLVPFGDNDEGAKNLSYGKRSHFIDHKIEDDLDNLVTLIGVRYTTARGDSAKAINLICKKLGLKGRVAKTDSISVAGGDIADFESTVHKLYEEQALNLSEDCVRALVHNYGTEAGGIVALAQQDKPLAATLGDTQVLKAEVVNAVKNELAYNLTDVVFRRTDLASGSNPGKSVLKECAEIMSGLLNWDEQEINKQVDKVLQRFPAWNL
ncbi:MAG: glycerol-3-phosphate dehydrogenase/oxidase [Ignavibacteriaceae bacterium]|nr:glycerol-3-phosphate dehydrogenase/oxidase [Eudoraea sp.]NNJ51688.1 glycerol-3-phosphate dehydrogenase/oxidase [Ignavibacteriaceae bacterium]